MAGVQAGGENAVSWQKGIRYMLLHIDQLHLWLAGAGAGATFVTVAAFSPRFRQWNPALSRSDVLRKVFVSAAIGGCAGYVVARQLQYIAEEVSNDSRRTIRRVRAVLAEMDKSNFIASYPPLVSVSTDRTDNTSSAPSSISERIFSLCFHTLTPSPPFYSMRNCLEHDLLERGVSRRDTDITVSCLASALNRDEWGDFASGFTLSLALFYGRSFWRSHPRSVLLRAPTLPCALAFVGDLLLLVIAVPFPRGMDLSRAAYANLIEDKDAVAAVLRAKFRKQLESGSQ